MTFFPIWLFICPFQPRPLPFLDEIVEWAKRVFDRPSNDIKKAWVYIRRVPGILKEMVRYIKDGRIMAEESREVNWDEIVAMHDSSDIDDDTFEQLEQSFNGKRIAELYRNNPNNPIEIFFYQ